jgi:hypothetical protein
VKWTTHLFPLRKVTLGCYTAVGWGRRLEPHLKLYTYIIRARVSRVRSALEIGICEKYSDIVLRRCVTFSLWWEVSMIPWIMLQRATNGRGRHSHRRSGATLLGRSSEEKGRMGGSSAAMRGAQANKGQRSGKERGYRYRARREREHWSNPHLHYTLCT